MTFISVRDLYLCIKLILCTTYLKIDNMLKIESQCSNYIALNKYASIHIEIINNNIIHYLLQTKIKIHSNDGIEILQLKLKYSRI